MELPLKVTIVANVRRLLAIPEGVSGVSRVMLLGFVNGTAQRILNENTNIGFDILERLAKALGVQPWQLLVSDLDPQQMPTLEPLSFRWPFRHIDPEVVTGLVGSAAQNIENGLLAALATQGIAARRPSQAASEKRRSTGA